MSMSRFLLLLLMTLTASATLLAQDAQAIAQRIDQRSVLYWNPCVTIDGHQDGTTAFDFYASDARDTRYIINIEGIASDGTPFKATRAFDKR